MVWQREPGPLQPDWSAECLRGDVQGETCTRGRSQAVGTTDERSSRLGPKVASWSAGRGARDAGEGGRAEQDRLL